MTARTLAITKKKPLYAVNHVEGHVYANFLTTVTSHESRVVAKHSGSDAVAVAQSAVATSDSAYNTWELGGQQYVLPVSQPEFPLLALIVSGGHSQLALFRDHFDYTLLGQTRDDAIGEAFDKVAKITGLPYPGGPSVAQAALKGDPNKYKLPKSRLTGDNPALDELRSQTSNLDPRASRNYDFSFSGLKTAVLRLAQEEIGENYAFPSYQLAERLSEAQKCDIAASFQRVAVETVVDKTVLAYEEFAPKSVVIAGGVAANQELRRQLAERLPCPIAYTDIKLCTDNGAMMATLGCYKAMLGAPPADPYTLQIQPNLSM
jgi:N6-L-threonylcarbamoyladenine synthase